MEHYKTQQSTTGRNWKNTVWVYSQWRYFINDITTVYQRAYANGSPIVSFSLRPIIATFTYISQGPFATVWLSQFPWGIPKECRWKHFTSKTISVGKAFKCGHHYWFTLWPIRNLQHFADDIFKCIFSMKMFEFFWLKFHWSLFLVVSLTISQHWFR